MAILKNSARLIFAGGFAVAITIGPVVATFAGPTTPPAARTIADPNNNNCTVNQTKGSVSLACAPGVVAGRGSHRRRPVRGGRFSRDADSAKPRLRREADGTGDAQMRAPRCGHPANRPSFSSS